MRIVEALEKAEATDEGVENGWQLLLSYPPQKVDDAAAVRALAERIARLALRQSVSQVSRLADRLSYWLDQADEVAPGFQGAEQLWARLLPFAITLANQPQERAGETANDRVIDCLGRLYGADHRSGRRCAPPSSPAPGCRRGSIRCDSSATPDPCRGLYRVGLDLQTPTVGFISRTKRPTGR
jgi:hypothetical protein